MNDTVIGWVPTDWVAVTSNDASPDGETVVAEPTGTPPTENVTKRPERFVVPDFNVAFSVGFAKWVVETALTTKLVIAFVLQLPLPVDVR